MGSSTGRFLGGLRGQQLLQGFPWPGSGGVGRGAQPFPSVAKTLLLVQNGAGTWHGATAGTPGKADGALMEEMCSSSVPGSAAHLQQCLGEPWPQPSKPKHSTCGHRGTDGILGARVRSELLRSNSPQPLLSSWGESKRRRSRRPCG